MHGIKTELQYGEPASYLVLASPRRTALVLFLTDLATVTASLLLAAWVRYLFDRTLPLEAYLSLWPAVALFPFAYALAGLYGVGIAPPEELRRLSYATSLVFIALGSATFMYKTGADYSRGAFAFAWGLALVLVPLGRALVRELFSRRPWWGEAVVVLGAGKTGIAVVRALRRRPGLGLKPVALLDDDPDKEGREVEGVPVVGGLERAREFAQRGVRYAIVAMPGVERERLLALLERHGGDFPHLILIPDLFGLPSLWVLVRDFGGVLGLEVRQQLLRFGPRVTKRLLDGLILLLLFVPVSALILLIATVLKLSSREPVFYKQERLGLNGRRFTAFKFRTMYGDGERRLRALLEKSPELREEYERFHKIKDDPRVTPIGRYLRAWSLDELPQFFNVLRGEMSFVGPRAYLPRELAEMGRKANTILSVAPGITGLWQVSGRNHLTFEERLELDVYYVRNWSPWLDLYILARTVWVVLTRKGAY